MRSPGDGNASSWALIHLQNVRISPNPSSVALRVENTLLRLRPHQIIGHGSFRRDIEHRGRSCSQVSGHGCDRNELVCIAVSEARCLTSGGSLWGLSAIRFLPLVNPLSNCSCGLCGSVSVVLRIPRRSRRQEFMGLQSILLLPISTKMLRCNAYLTPGRPVNSRQSSSQLLSRGSRWTYPRVIKHAGPFTG